MRRALLAAAGAAALVTPAAEAVAATQAADAATATPKKKVVVTTKSVTGSPGFAGRWGNVQVTLVVKRTATTIGTKTTVTRKITGVTVPVYPNHTDRSVFINQQALPLLVQEVLQAQFDPNIQLISGATDTSQGFVQSLQSALLAARKA